ncbi:hypothetical protein [Catenulispora rubra]|nr:hypothetical protein [Catenulispora rubra]
MSSVIRGRAAVAEPLVPAGALAFAFALAEPEPEVATEAGSDGT